MTPKLRVARAILRADEARRAAERADHELEILRAELAADPEVRATMSPWLLEFRGARRSNMDKDGSVRLVPSDEVTQYVNEFMRPSGIPLARAGSGERGWFVAYECSDRTLEISLAAARQNAKLQKYIAAGVLSLSVHFSAWHFHGLYSPEDARRFIEGAAS